MAPKNLTRVRGPRSLVRLDPNLAEKETKTTHSNIRIRGRCQAQASEFGGVKVVQHVSLKKKETKPKKAKGALGCQAERNAPSRSSPRRMEAKGQKMTRTLCRRLGPAYLKIIIIQIRRTILFLGVEPWGQTCPPPPRRTNISLSSAPGAVAGPRGAHGLPVAGLGLRAFRRYAGPEVSGSHFPRREIVGAAALPTPNPTHAHFPFALSRLP